MSKKLESKSQILSKLLGTIEIICNKAVQLNILPIPQLHFEYNTNDTKESEREEIKVLDINNTSNNQMNNLNFGKTDSIENQLNNVKIKKEKSIID